MHGASPVAIARNAYQQMQDEAFALSPLADAASWTQTGHPPTAKTLRRAGFNSGGDYAATWLVKRAFNRKFSFAIPCAEAIERLSELGPLLEIGAGSGYWSALLAAAGVDIIATDAMGSGSPGYRQVNGVYCQLTAMEALDAVRGNPDRNIFCCWPSHGAAWSAEAVRAMAPGRTLALIGEARGGTSGSDDLFDALEDLCRPLGEVSIPQFPGICDSMTLHLRR